MFRRLSNIRSLVLLCVATFAISACESLGEPTIRFGSAEEMINSAVSELSLDRALAADGEELDYARAGVTHHDGYTRIQVPTVSGMYFLSLGFLEGGELHDALLTRVSVTGNNSFASSSANLLDGYQFTLETNLVERLNIRDYALSREDFAPFTIRGYDSLTSMVSPGEPIAVDDRVLELDTEDLMHRSVETLDFLATRTAPLLASTDVEAQSSRPSQQCTNTSEYRRLRERVDQAREAARDARNKYEDAEEAAEDAEYDLRRAIISYDQARDALKWAKIDAAAAAGAVVVFCTTTVIAPVAAPACLAAMAAVLAADAKVIDAEHKLEIASINLEEARDDAHEALEDLAEAAEDWIRADEAWVDAIEDLNDYIRRNCSTR